jgi:hypothetical protein
VTTTQPLDSRTGSAAAAPVDAPATTPSPRRRRRRLPQIGPVLPARMRPINRPMIWLEIALIGISYYVYTLTRLAAPAHESGAENRGWAILHFEHYLGINFEHTVNHAVYNIKWLIFSMNVYYATLHFIVPIAVLVWVYWKFPDRYRALRTVMFAMTGLALLGFYFYSLAPPRLLGGGGFIDTFKLLNPWGQTSATSDGVAGMSGTNEYAAMPSLHIGWSTWCAIAIAYLAKRNWVKVLGILYPFATFAVIISTANHYVLDAVGGLVVLGLGFLVQRLLQGRPVFTAEPSAPADADATLPKQGGGSSGGSSGGESDTDEELVRTPVRVYS